VAESRAEARRRPQGQEVGSAARRSKGDPGSRRAGRVGARRVRGCRLVFSSRLSTRSQEASGRVSRSAMSCTCRAKAASRGFWAESHRWWRHGLSLCWRKMRRTVSLEIPLTSPSATNVRAISAQSH